MSAGIMNPFFLLYIILLSIEFFRREDIVKFGGKGSGVTWSGGTRKFIFETFYKDGDRMMPSDSTIRRVGIVSIPKILWLN